MQRFAPNDIVRLYGFPGTFVCVPHHSAIYGEDGCYVYRPYPDGGQGIGFPASQRSIVEVNGVPCPLLSAPLAPPAKDYPHVPQFDYDDGPQELGQEALRYWLESHPQTDPADIDLAQLERECS